MKKVRRKTISVEIDGQTYTGILTITGTRDLEFLVEYEGRAKTDAMQYPPDREGYLEGIAEQLLRELVRESRGDRFGL